MMAETNHSTTIHRRSNGSRKTNLARSDSLVSLARAPFSVQLHRLTSLSLPSPDSLHTRILDTESPSESLTRLRNIATDVHKWINTASTVLSQLDADDDVEWAARGRDSLAKVENAARRFGEIVEMFLDAATILSARSDDRIKEEIKELISIMDEVTHGWSSVRELLKGLREQVALSTEWMEIREILDDISSELDTCANMVFELEEMRHLSKNQSSGAETTGASPSSSMELDRLTNILEQHTKVSAHSSPTHNPYQIALLRLSARIQPLRASLDFLKPRLSSFGSRAEKTFPTALEEILQRNLNLERRWNKIESDYRNIGRELQEDEWVDVFRNVGKQVHEADLKADFKATDLMDSLTRSITTLGTYLPDALPPVDLIENYVAKKTYYPSAIDRVLGVLDRGYKHRVTFNGQIGRNYDELCDRWNDIQLEMRKTDELLNALSSETDTVSTISRDVKDLSIVTEKRPRSTGSTSSDTTLTQGAVSASISPTASRDSSIRSSNRVSSLPTPRRESQRDNQLQSNSVTRDSSVSSAASTASTSRRMSLFTPTRIKTPTPRPSTALGTGTGGLIPIEARPRWNSSPIANVLGSPVPKLPTVVVTPSRIPLGTGRANPVATNNSTPIHPPQTITAGTTSLGKGSVSPPKRTSMYAAALPGSIKFVTPPKRPASPSKRMSMTTPRPVQRMVSNSALPRSTPEDIPENTGPTSKISTSERKQTANLANLRSARRLSGIPRPTTPQRMNARSVSGSTAPQGQPRWRG